MVVGVRSHGPSTNRRQLHSLFPSSLAPSLHPCHVPVYLLLLGPHGSSYAGFVAPAEQRKSAAHSRAPHRRALNKYYRWPLGLQLFNNCCHLQLHDRFRTSFQTTGSPRLAPFTRFATDYCLLHQTFANPSVLSVYLL